MAEERDEAPTELEPLKPTPEQAEGVRRQREHIEALDGEDPLRGGVAD
jgi:hypothetical protein